MPDAFAIRPYEDGDLAACRALWAELTEAHRQLYADPTIGGDEPGRAFDGPLAAAEGIWVADADGEVVGLAGLLVGGGKGELEPVVVAVAWRGRGVGRRLVEAVVAASRDRGLRHVSVRPVGRNSEAIRFFHALGFDVLARVDTQLDLDPRSRQPGERIAGRDFRV